MSLSGTVRIRYLMDQTVCFGLSDDFKGLFTGNLSASAGTDIVFGSMAHLNTHILLQVTAAFSHDFSCCTAGTIRNGKDFIIIEI